MSPDSDSGALPRARGAAARAADPRAAGALALTELLRDGRSLDAALDEALAGIAAERDRALARELALGVARWLPRLEALLALLLRKPLGPRDRAVQVILLMGLYQLLYTRVPEHAAVNESVQAVKAAGSSWASGLVNAVLRRFTRERDTLLARVDSNEAARYAHPAWLIEATRDAWPECWREVLAANNERAPLSLRVNARLTTREAYLRTLETASLGAHAIAHTTQGVRLERPVDVERLPGFAQGLVSVQDGAAQRAGARLDAPAGARVLDACCAPGGKTTHLLERRDGDDEADGSRLIALDVDETRLARVHENLERLHLSATVVCGDALSPGDWWDGEPFQRILLDAPCSATGVIRRHPDIKRLRRAGDVESLAATQAALLDALWPLLADEGLLLYATCSYLPRENDQVVEAFLASHPDAASVAISGTWGRTTRHGRQVLPGADAMDGFYYAMLGKH